MSLSAPKPKLGAAYLPPNSLFLFCIYPSEHVPPPAIFYVGDSTYESTTVGGIIVYICGHNFCTKGNCLNSVTVERLGAFASNALVCLFKLFTGPYQKRYNMAFTAFLLGAWSKMGRVEKD